MENYQLSVELRGHEQDVRAVCELNNGWIATASRDTTIRLWNTKGDVSSPFVLHGHQHFVGSLTSLIPTETHPNRLFASGGYDHVINVWDSTVCEGKDAPILVLIGHEKPVVTLSQTSTGDIVSGSWDNTARVWHDAECVDVLIGHEAAVWSVLVLHDGYDSILTASADKTIKMWRGLSGRRNCVGTFNHHTDVVRGLANLESVGFVSCANDGLVTLWSSQGEVIQDLVGHQEFVYSVSVVSGHMIVSCGEDRTVRVWENAEVQQTIIHPKSVWCVGALGNGDIVSGSADGVARVFTRDPARIGHPEIVQKFDEEVSKSITQSEKSIGSIQLDKLPGLESLINAGKKIGENKVVRNGTKAEAYQWDGQNWVNMGEVFDSANESQGSKALLEGKEYDYVFDIDINDGVKYKIGFNNGQNPYQVAQEFIWKEDLSQEFLEQIAQFLFRNTQNSGPMVLGQAPTTQPILDPLTGANAYRAGSARSNNNNSSTVAQPLSSNPFIQNSGAYISGPGRDEQSQRSHSETTIKYFPQKSMTFFDAGKPADILKKINEFNNVLLNDPVNKDLALSVDLGEVTSLENLINTLKDIGRYHATFFTETQFLLVEKKLLHWPKDKIFPILDMVRFMILHPDGSRHYKSLSQISGKFDLLSTLLNIASTGGGGSPPVSNNQMLVLRGITNMFKNEALRSVAVTNQEKILNFIGECARNDHKGVRVSVVTLILNYTVVWSSGASGSSVDLFPLKNHALSILNEILTSDDRNDIVLQALIGVGTLIHGDRKVKEIANVNFEVGQTAQKFNKSEDIDVKACSTALLKALQN